MPAKSVAGIVRSEVQPAKQYLNDLAAVSPRKALSSNVVNFSQSWNTAPMVFTFDNPSNVPALSVVMPVL